MSEIKLTLDFFSIEDLHNHNIDLIRTLQASLNSDIRNDSGFYLFYLLEQFANKSYEIAQEAETNNQSLKPVA